MNMAAKKRKKVQNLRTTEVVITRQPDGEQFLMTPTEDAGQFKGERLAYWQKLARKGELTKLEQQAALMFAWDHWIAEGDPRYATLDYNMERIDGTSGVDARILGPAYRQEARDRRDNVILVAGVKGGAALKLVVGEDMNITEFAEVYQVTRHKAKGWLEAGLSCAAQAYGLVR